jgi:hypothetical protein
MQGPYAVFRSKERSTCSSVRLSGEDEGASAPEKDPCTYTAPLSESVCEMIVNITKPNDGSLYTTNHSCPDFANDEFDST